MAQILGSRRWPGHGVQVWDPSTPLPDALTCAVHVRHLVCVTLYNEPLAALEATLRSLLAPWQGDAGRAPRELCIALMSDGCEHLDPAVLAAWVGAGLVPPAWRAGLPESVDGALFCFSQQGVNGLPWAQGGTTPVATALCPEEPARLSWVVCLKPRNQGKLHSHALFFGALSPALDPTYCYQVDAGTCVGPQALPRLGQAFEQQLNTAALASCVTTPAPTDAAGLLARWQFMDMATQQSVLWPAEVSTGHLSVMPGQFCALRWEALWTPGVAAASQPLQGYLKGLSSSAALDRLMYLAEDRVLGNQITLAQRAWHLGYAHQVHAVTDACGTWGELARQRRRWNNSASACRVWMLGQWPRYWRRPDRSLRAKGQFSLAMCWQISLLLRQWLAPAVVASVLSVLAAACALAPTWQALAWLGSTGLAALLSVVRVGDPAARTVWRDLAWAGVLLQAVGLLATLLPLWGVLVLGLPWLGLVALTCRQLGGSAWRVWRLAPEFLLFTNPLLQLCLTAYSVAHLHDLSWGTKGLVQSRAAGVKQPARLGLWRGAAVVAWGLANVLAYGLVAQAVPPGWHPWGLVPVVAGLVGLSGMAALWFRARSARTGLRVAEVPPVATALSGLREGV